MKKKYVLGSILCILLMLVSTQTVLLNFVKSDPTLHEGEALVGDLWISELNVSSVLEEVAFVGIGHANATDDYVTWENGEGEIVAKWMVNIETKYHPDYCVMFSLIAYNIDENNSEMDTDYCVINYDADTEYNDSGQLSLSIQFDQDFLENNTEATLVCYLNAAVRINNTEEAVNFTTWGQDRCVVGVVLDKETSEQPYSRFRTEANSNFPNIWSWLPGWNESNRFDDEEDMLESQTFFYVSGDQSSEKGDWKLGQFDIYMDYGFYSADFTRNLIPYQIHFNQGEQNVNPYISLVYHYSGGPQISLNRFFVIHEGPESLLDRTTTSQPAYYPDENMGVSVLLHDYDDENTDDFIIFVGQAWSVGWMGHTRATLLSSVHINLGEDQLEPAIYSDTGYYWMNSCGYFNTTYSLDVDSSTNFGITTVDCDISEVLLDNGQYVYTNAADAGDTRVQMVC